MAYLDLPRKKCSTILEQCSAVNASLWQAKEQAISAFVAAKAAARDSAEYKRPFFEKKAEKELPQPEAPVKPACLFRIKEEQRKAELIKARSISTNI